MIRIFLAHASEDKEAVMHLHQRLKEQGFQPWLDKVDLLPGQNWRAEIPQAIKNSDMFIACLSQKSVEKQGYIQREFRMALNEMANRPPGQIFLIPVRLDDCQIPELRQEEYGINLSDYQWADLFEPNGFDRLVQSIDLHFPASLIERIRVLCKSKGFTKSPELLTANKIRSWINELGTGPKLQVRVDRHIAYWATAREDPSLSHKQLKAMLDGYLSSDLDSAQPSQPRTSNEQ